MAYRATQEAIVDDESELLAVLCGEAAFEMPTLEDALGLLDPAQRTKPPEIRLPHKWLVFTARPEPLVTPAVVACIHALDDLVHRQRETAIIIKGWDGAAREELLGNVTWTFRPRQRSLEDDLPDSVARAVGSLVVGARRDVARCGWVSSARIRAVT